MIIGSIVGSSALRVISGLLQKRPAEGAQRADGPPPPATNKAGLGTIIQDALKSIGLDTSSGTDPNASSNDAGSAKSAARAFVKELFTALHAQSQSGAPAPGRFERDLRSLLSKVASSESSSDNQVTALKDKFSALVSALGGTSDANGLQGVLEKLQSAVQAKDKEHCGQLISTAA